MADYERKGIAGEKIKAGDLVYYHLSTRRYYRFDGSSASDGSVAGHNADPEQPLTLVTRFVASQFDVPPLSLRPIMWSQCSSPGCQAPTALATADSEGNLIAWCAEHDPRNADEPVIVSE